MPPNLLDVGKRGRPRYDRGLAGPSRRFSPVTRAHSPHVWQPLPAAEPLLAAVEDALVRAFEFRIENVDSPSSVSTNS